MKKAFTLFLLAFTCMIKGYATVITVSNNPQVKAQYTDVKEAISKAVAGDTLYIHGSETSYGTVEVDKKLTFIGTGYAPENQYKILSTFDEITLKTNSDPKSASGSAFIGLTMQNLGMRTLGLVSDVTIKRCKIAVIGGLVPSGPIAADWIVANNIINSMYFTYGTNRNILIQNNVIYVTTQFADQSFNILITNNIFLGGTLSAKYAVIANNIFHATNLQNIKNSIFNNNILFKNPVASVVIALPFGTNTGSGNLQSDPLLTKYQTPGVFSFTDDYTLAAGSPALKAGTDGTDLGITGGPSALTIQQGSEPFIPQVKSFDIMNSYLEKGGSLNIKSKAAVKN